MSFSITLYVCDGSSSRYTRHSFINFYILRKVHYTCFGHWIHWKALVCNFAEGSLYQQNRFSHKVIWARLVIKIIKCKSDKMKGFWLTVRAQLIGEQFAVHRATFNQFSFYLHLRHLCWKMDNLWKAFRKGTCVGKRWKCENHTLPYGSSFWFVQNILPICRPHSARIFAWEYLLKVLNWIFNFVPALFVSSYFLNIATMKNFVRWSNHV